MFTREEKSSSDASSVTRYRCELNDRDSRSISRAVGDLNDYVIEPLVARIEGRTPSLAEYRAHGRIDSVSAVTAEKSAASACIVFLWRDKEIARLYVVGTGLAVTFSAEVQDA